MLTRKTTTTLLASAFLFLLLLLLAWQIDFFQKDDWVFHKNIKMFTERDFSLDDWVAPTFYVQGMLALVFVKLFTLEKLPVLTLIISIGNFFLATQILERFFKLSLPTSLLGGILFLFNPIVLYLTWGFMSGLYFLFFCLLCVHLFLEAKEQSFSSKKHFLYLVVVCVTGFFVRQVALVLPLSLGIYFFLKKEIRPAFLFTGLFLVLYSYLQYLFPKTYAMQF